MAGVIERVFTIEHNRLGAARQEYELADEYYSEVLKYYDGTNPDHLERFAYALERLQAAREAYLKALLVHG